MEDRSWGGKEGNVLLLSLLILSVVMLGSAAVSSIVIRDLRAGKLHDSGHQAYYAAESGVEQALYLLRRTETTPKSIESGADTLANNSKFDRKVFVGEAELFIPLLQPNDFVQVDLFDPDNLSSPGIKSLSFEWQDNCGGCTILEASYAQWPIGSNISWPPNNYSGTFWKFQRQLGTQPQIWYLDSLSAQNNYRLRIRNLGLANQSGSIQNLRIRGWGDDSHQQSKDIPSRIFINVTGKFAGAEQALTSSMQRSSSLSAIFNYVIFSEGDIIKK